MTSPFKFLDSYTREDREIFFGREKEIEELYHRVFESKILLVYGISGTGKSSLINCGLANKFQETDWLPVIVRRGTNIIESMAAAVRSASVTVKEEKSVTRSVSRKDVLSLYLDYYKPVYFIFDQFEELFIFGDKEERRAFIQIIKSLIESDLQCRMIFIMREEYMAGVTEFERFIPTFFANRVRIERMSHRNALDAIKGPCKVFNISLEEGFAESLLEKLSPGETDVELTYLQVFLDKIFRLATQNLLPFRPVPRSFSEAGGAGGSAQSADGFLAPPGPAPSEASVGELKGGSAPAPGEPKEVLSFTINLLQKAGNVSDLLGSFLDDQIALLEDQDTALALLKSFVSVKGTKQPMTPEEAREYAITLGRDIKTQVVTEMIQTFVNRRILCDKDQHDRYELRHDALAAKIFEKFTLSEKELLEVRRFVENSYDTYEKRGILLNKQDIDYLAASEKKLILPERINKFIEISKKKYETQRKALRRITTISTVILLILLAFVLRFYIQKQNETSVNDMFSLALLEAVEDPVKGLYSELKIWEQDTTSVQLHEIILRDFQRVANLSQDTNKPLQILKQYLKPVVLESDITKAYITRSGQYIYGWLVDNTIFIHETATGNTSYLKNTGKVKHIEFSPENSIMAAVNADNQVTVYDLKGTRLFEFGITANEMNSTNLVRFMNSGKGLLAAVSGRSVTIFDKRGLPAYRIEGHTGPINSIDISGDGDFLVTASSDRKGFIWNYNPEVKGFSIYDSLIGHKGKIWSARFNRTGKYVITASEDSTIKIWDLNGNQINPELRFIIMSTHLRLNNGEDDEDRANPYYSRYYGKFCDATFSPSELEIVATGYDCNYNPDQGCENYKVLFFDGAGGFPHAYQRVAFIPDNTLIRNKQAVFKELLVSPDEKIAAVMTSDSSRISLITGQGAELWSFNGHNPMFSASGREFYWVSGNRIKKLLTHPDEIKKILEKFNIKPDGIKKEKSLLEI